MSVSSIGADAQSLLIRQMQTLQAQQSSTDRASQRKADLEAALKAAGADSSKLADIEEQIDAAVQQAQQNSDGSTDPRTAIKDAVDAVLKENGLDPAKFEAQMKAQHAHGHHRRSGVLAALGNTLETAQPQPVLSTTTETSTDASALNVLA